MTVSSLPVAASSLPLADRFTRRAGYARVVVAGTYHVDAGEGVASVRDLTRSDGGAAARLLTAAFLDEPLWRVVGPAWRVHRRATLRVLYRNELGKARRWGGPNFAADVRGSLAGVAIAFDAGRWPPPQPWSTLRDLPSLAIAGPLATLRAGQVDWKVQRLRPRQPHVYLYLLAVDPALQHRGVGTALVEAVARHAAERRLPVCLETMSPSNPAFYAKQGFEVTAECELLDGARAWLMRRDP